MAFYLLIIMSLLTSYVSASLYQPENGTTSYSVDIQWDNVLLESKTVTNLQAVVNPLMMRNSSIHDNAFDALWHSYGPYVRFQGWYPYPHLVVAELDPPIKNSTHCSTSWDFIYLDPLVEDFFQNTPDVPHLIDLSTSPNWMWIQPNGTTYSYPASAVELDFAYNTGTELRDPTFTEISDYFARVVSWYTRGGFTDECGIYHHSGHSYQFDLWEVLNEIGVEHSIQPAYYVQIYDAITKAVHAVSPTSEFVGVALENPALEYFLEFLDPSKHSAGTPPRAWVSAHMYGFPQQNETTANQIADCYSQAELYLANITKIKQMRDHFSPNTKIALDELGTILPLAAFNVTLGYTIPDDYFVWSGGFFAYMFSRVVTMGIDIVGASQLLANPGNFESVELVNYKTGLPNARLRVLQLLQHNFEPGNSVINTTSSKEDLFHAQAFLTTYGQRKLLIVNKMGNPFQLQVDCFMDGYAEIVDLSTGNNTWRTEFINGSTFAIPMYATVVFTAN